MNLFSWLLFAALSNAEEENVALQLRVVAEDTIIEKDNLASGGLVASFKYDNFGNPEFSTQGHKGRYTSGNVNSRLSWCRSSSGRHGVICNSNRRATVLVFPLLPNIQYEYRVYQYLNDGNDKGDTSLTIEAGSGVGISTSPCTFDATWCARPGWPSFGRAYPDNNGTLIIKLAKNPNVVLLGIDILATTTAATTADGAWVEAREKCAAVRAICTTNCLAHCQMQRLFGAKGDAELTKDYIAKVLCELNSQCGVAGGSCDDAMATCMTDAERSVPGGTPAAWALLSVRLSALRAEEQAKCTAGRARCETHCINEHFQCHRWPDEHKARCEVHCTVRRFGRAHQSVAGSEGSYCDQTHNTCMGRAGPAGSHCDLRVPNAAFWIPHCA